MKILYSIFFIAALCFVVIGMMGHTMAWSAAALCFFGATMVIIGQRNHKNNNKRD